MYTLTLERGQTSSNPPSFGIHSHTSRIHDPGTYPPPQDPDILALSSSCVYTNAHMLRITHKIQTVCFYLSPNPHIHKAQELTSTPHPKTHTVAHITVIDPQIFIYTHASIHIAFTLKRTSSPRNDSTVNSHTHSHHYRLSLLLP